MNNATRWFLALLLSSLLPEATEAQATLSLMRTRISFTDGIGGAGLFYEAPGTATRDYGFDAPIGEADGSSSYLDVIGRASTMASLAGKKGVSLRVEAISNPSAGHVRESNARGEAILGLSYQVRETRTPPFSLIPLRLPVMIEESGSVEVTGVPDLSIPVPGGNLVSGARGTAQIDIRDANAVSIFSQGVIVDTFQTPDIADSFGPDTIRIIVRTGTEYSLGLIASCAVVSPATIGYVACEAKLDPLVEFDQDAFDAMVRAEGLEPYQLSDYYTIDYSPNLPAPEPESATLVAIGWSAAAASRRRMRSGRGA